MNLPFKMIPLLTKVHAERVPRFPDYVPGIKWWIGHKTLISCLPYLRICHNFPGILQSAGSGEATKICAGFSVPQRPPILWRFSELAISSPNPNCQHGCDEGQLQRQWTLSSFIWRSHCQSNSLYNFIIYLFFNKYQRWNTRKLLTHKEKRQETFIPKIFSNFVKDQSIRCTFLRIENAGDIYFYTNNDSMIYTI